MRSIRLSLIFYFLILITVALGAVSWLVYQSAAETVHARQAAAHDLIEEQYEKQCREAREVLDNHLVAQAHYMASKARSEAKHWERFYHFGAVGAAGMPQAYPDVLGWLFVYAPVPGPWSKKLSDFRP